MPEVHVLQLLHIYIYIYIYYRASGQAFTDDNGHTYYKAAAGTADDSDGFNAPKNYWNVQGCTENDDSKTLVYTHTMETKNTASSTTIYNTNNPYKGLNTIIISPHAKQKRMDLHRIKELFLASASSDGDVGDYEIYATNSLDINIQFKPADSSWRLIKKKRIFVSRLGTQQYKHR